MLPEKTISRARVFPQITQGSALGPDAAEMMLNRQAMSWTAAATPIAAIGDVLLAKGAYTRLRFAIEVKMATA